MKCGKCIIKWFVIIYSPNTVFKRNVIFLLVLITGVKMEQIKYADVSATVHQVGWELS
jgi:hypothetical protein